MDRYNDIRNAGFSLADLCVLIAGLMLMFGLVLPNLQQRRAAERETRCRNNLRRIALASLEHDIVKEQLPPYMAVPVELLPGEYSSDHYQFTYSLIQLLSFLGESEAVEQTDPFAFSAETLTIQQMGYPTFVDWRCGIDKKRPGIGYVFRDFQPDFAKCPSDTVELNGVAARVQANRSPIFPFPELLSAGFELPNTNYVANIGMIGLTINANPVAGFEGGYGPIRSRQSDRVLEIVDGASNVAMFGESMGFVGTVPGIGKVNIRYSSALGGVAMGRYDLFVPSIELFGTATDSQELQFGSMHSESVNVARCDGSVIPVNRNVTPEEFGKFCGAADGAKHLLD